MAHTFNCNGTAYSKCHTMNETQLHEFHNMRNQLTVIPQSHLQHFDLTDPHVHRTSNPMGTIQYDVKQSARKTQHGMVEKESKTFT